MATLSLTPFPSAPFHLGEGWRWALGRGHCPPSPTIITGTRKEETP